MRLSVSRFFANVGVGNTNLLGPGVYIRVDNSEKIQIDEAPAMWSGTDGNPGVPMIYVRELQLAGTFDDLIQFSEKLHSEAEDEAKMAGEVLPDLLTTNRGQECFASDTELTISLKIPAVVSREWFNGIDMNGSRAISDEDVASRQADFYKWIGIPDAVEWIRVDPDIDDFGVCENYEADDPITSETFKDAKHGSYFTVIFNEKQLCFSYDWFKYMRENKMVEYVPRRLGVVVDDEGYGSFPKHQLGNDLEYYYPLTNEYTFFMDNDSYSIITSHKKKLDRYKIPLVYELKKIRSLRLGNKEGIFGVSMRHGQNPPEDIFRIHRIYYIINNRNYFSDNMINFAIEENIPEVYAELWNHPNIKINYSTTFVKACMDSGTTLLEFFLNDDRVDYDDIDVSAIELCMHKDDWKKLELFAQKKEVIEKIDFVLIGDIIRNCIGMKTNHRKWFQGLVSLIKSMSPITQLRGFKSYQRSMGHKAAEQLRLDNSPESIADGTNKSVSYGDIATYMMSILESIGKRTEFIGMF
jgi:hypothetical protein